MTRPADFSNSNLKIGKSAPGSRRIRHIIQKAGMAAFRADRRTERKHGFNSPRKRTSILRFVSVMINRAFGATGTASAFSSRRRKHRFDLDQRRLALIERRLQRLRELLFCLGSVTG